MGEHAGERTADRYRELFRTIFENAPFGIAVVSLSGTLVEANPGWAATVKRSRGALRGAELAGLALPGHAERIRAALDALIGEGVAADSFEIVIPLPDGGDVHCRLALSLARGPGDAPIDVIAQLQDISERRHSEQQLHFQADHDPLTDVLNRRAFERELTARLHGARSSDQTAMLLVDLDGLKEVNDQFGHPAGDETLRGLGASLLRRIREADPIGRVGGDEFAVLAGTNDPDALARLAGRILVEVRSHSREQGIPVSVSIGIAHLVAAMSDRELWRRADSALHAAKAAGGDCHVFWSQDLSSVPRISRD